MNPSDLPRELIDALEKDQMVAYVLDRSLTILYCNPAWDVFAQKNNGADALRKAVVGRRLTDCVGPLLRPLYVNAFNAAFETNRSWERVIECSSPELFRLIRIFATPVLRGQALIVTCGIEVEYPHGAEREIALPDERTYRGENGLIVMCSGCRRTRRANAEIQWDWVPAYVSHRQEGVSHGLCPACIHHYFPAREPRSL